MVECKYQPLNQKYEPENKIKISNDRFWNIWLWCILLLVILYYETSLGTIEKQPVNYIDNFMNNYEYINNASIELNITFPIQSKTSDNTSSAMHKKYFVNTQHCRMPYVDPFTPEALKLFKSETYKNCSSDKSLISTIYDRSRGKYFLHINTQYTHDFSKQEGDYISCCYQEILRAGSGKNADNQFKILPCTIFHQNFMVPAHVDGLITECKLNSTQKVIQKDAFTFVQYKKFTKPTTVTEMLNIRRKPGVLLLGIDSLSRINFRRTMPKSAEFLESNHWFELQGYNKMGDNTFPNLLALLAGLNETTAYQKCKPYLVGGLDKCPFIWHDFKRFGYRTAYAEDTGHMSTFNYLKKGFAAPPTDHYLHSMTLAMEKALKVVSRNGLPFCVGRKHYAEYIYDYALQFSSCYSGEPIFGLFWANSFSHNNFNTATSMDDKMLQYLKALEAKGILESSIVMFFSDHGRRWGPLLELHEGFLEERLPMFFISLPKWFKNAHPDIERSLVVNKNRLTSPYDIFMTLNHILELYEPGLKLPQATDCKKCQSIFRKVPENRTCNDVGITEHWCTCAPYETKSTDDDTVKLVTNLIIDEMNKYLEARNLSSKCHTMKLKSIKFAQLKLEEDDHMPHLPTYRITYKTNPHAAPFQATAVYDPKAKTVEVNVGSISRLNMYFSDARCTQNKQAKKYCICKK